MSKVPFSKNFTEIRQLFGQLELTAISKAVCPKGGRAVGKHGEGEATCGGGEEEGGQDEGGPGEGEIEEGDGGKLSKIQKLREWLV